MPEGIVSGLHVDSAEVVAENFFWGVSHGTRAAVEGNNTADGPGVIGASKNNEGIHAVTQSPGFAAIAAYNLNPEGTGAAVFAKKEGANGHAGFFDGNVWITGELGVKVDITLANADCAEDFDIANADLVEPGTVMVLGDHGVLQPSQSAYDKRVAGVVSGAGNYKPGIVLDKRGSQPNRKPIALLGKVYCKVDASYAPIEIGDLLTTSDRPGHAMKATEQFKAFGTIIGKALDSLRQGTGLIRILVAFMPGTPVERLDFTLATRPPQCQEIEWRVPYSEFRGVHHAWRD